METTEQLKILIVDDDVVITTLLETFLAKTGFQVKIATSTQECLEAIHDDTIKIVIMDYQLSDLTALELLPQLQNQGLTSEKKFIISSGNENAEKDFISHDIKIDAFIPKPYKPKELLDLINSLIKE